LLSAIQDILFLGAAKRSAGQLISLIVFSQKAGDGVKTRQLFVCFVRSQAIFRRQTIG
jgi:hypothetical protein